VVHRADVLVSVVAATVGRCYMGLACWWCVFVSAPVPATQSSSCVGIAFVGMYFARVVPCTHAVSCRARVD
jgi:hypothetical protein